MTEDIMTFEAKLRKLKGEEYSTSGSIYGLSVDTQSGKHVDFEQDDLDDLVVNVGVETDDDRRIMTELTIPASWDMTSNFVVLLEYLEIEPEEIHRLVGGDSHKTIPVTFDPDTEEYHIDFDSMRDCLIDGE